MESLFHNKFTKLNNTGAPMKDSFYHIKLTDIAFLV